MRRYLMPLIVFLALAGFLAAGLRNDPRELPSALVGKPAPEFTASRVGAGQGIFSPRQMAGKVWVLNVWASWCAPCRVEHPLLMRFAQQGLAPVVGLNYKDAEDAATTWLRTQGDPYVFSAADPAGRIGIDYGVYGVPETFVIDAHGVIRLRHAGPLTREVVEGKIAKLVRELNGA
ncbi:cytochrome c biogenesis protein CcmG/thiol:disulfide interchange protein DsbE [Pseudoduganella flava]|uniref:Cytochrome c biogenesis protein CcmG/thiol:disulfide interchange protein DsbE n=1 Tax=Pseudoduganella flava TaxID=871742 RepID=A0A562PNT9_9BURK|nr:DsbE family thiol:disulfide interchange protein [Pseudoduganella flava]QGZ40662.1 DsbE family thiol:disulfide interchange protein [Pseudoduganella flava]TWI46115.1 cytochrome c biogenesis protein CcmG/thiol:disulfide interchange protein DsbE [Pseudoduganella flava]